MRAAGNLGGSTSAARDPCPPPVGPSSPGRPGHPLSSPTTILTRDASCKLENFQDRDSLGPLPCTPPPQQGERKLRMACLGPISPPLLTLRPEGSILPRTAPTAIGVMTGNSAQPLLILPLPTGAQGLFPNSGWGWGQREQEHGSQGTWLGPATDSRS